MTEERRCIACGYLWRDHSNLRCIAIALVRRFTGRDLSR